MAVGWLRAVGLLLGTGRLGGGDGGGELGGGGGGACVGFGFGLGFGAVGVGVGVGVGVAVGVGAWPLLGGVPVTNAGGGKATTGRPCICALMMAAQVCAG